MERTDAEAVARVLAGDREAFGDLVERHGAALTAFAFTRLGDREEARDAVQEAFVSAFERLETLRKPERFRAWVFEIVRNACAMRMRAADTARKREKRTGETPASPEPTPLERTVDGERRARLRAAVEALPEPMRDAVLLRFLGGVGRSEAAAWLEISPAALDKRMQRALERLRGLLGEEEA
jgi:RNA polymerase sigma-70 factor, ECF subfamily